jgi:hypothetical protein
MVLLLFLVGVVLFLAGLLYLLKPQLVLRLNAFFRDTLFKDSIVLLNNRRVGTTLLLVSLVLLLLSKLIDRL